MNTVMGKNSTAVADGDQRYQDGVTALQIDAGASRLEFSVRKRLMFVKRLVVTGRFADVRGTIWLDEQEPSNSRAEVVIGAASIDTRNARRDKHLRNADFFDVERYPQLTFSSEHIEAVDRAAGRYRVTGTLTVHGVTRQVTLDAEYTQAQGTAQAHGINLTLAGTLNRRDFGIVWNKAAINVADEVTLTLKVHAKPA
jgi:polyisoprenoid-binding protein YceI